MRNLLYFVVIFIAFTSVSVNAAKKRRITNGNKQSFSAATYGARIYSQPDHIISKHSFRKHVTDNMKCTGTYCKNNKWSDSNGVGYDVDHIIDRNGPEFRSYSACKDIPANMIMLDSNLNRRLGAIAGHAYERSINEKLEMYGSDIINNARKNIESCIARQRKRNIQEDINVNWTQSIVLEYDDGIFIIPEGANITIYGYNETTGEGQDASCDICIWYEYTDLTNNVFVIYIVIAAIALVAFGAISALLINFGIKRVIHRNRNYAARKDVHVDQLYCDASNEAVLDVMSP